MARLKRIAGTPVSEGVRLEADRYTVFAVRNVDGDIAVRMRREPRRVMRALMRVPFLRGAVRFVRDFVRFFDGLSEAHELNPQPAPIGSRAVNAVAKFLRSSPQRLAAVFSGILLVLIAFTGMFAAPRGVETMLMRQAELSTAAVRWIACAVRAIGFLLFAFSAARLPVLNRFAVYRGALNQAANCCACTNDVTVDEAARYPRIARRSEPAFLTFTIFISLLLFALIPAWHPLLVIAARVGLILCVAAILNEPQTLLESAEITPAVSVLRGPMDLVELAASMKPDAKALEAAVCAFQAAMGDIEEIPEESV